MDCSINSKQLLCFVNANSKGVLHLCIAIFYRLSRCVVVGVMCTYVLTYTAYIYNIHTRWLVNIPKAHCSEGPLLRRCIIPKVHYTQTSSSITRHQSPTLNWYVSSLTI